MCSRSAELQMESSGGEHREQEGVGQGRGGPGEGRGGDGTGAGQGRGGICSHENALKLSYDTLHLAAYSPICNKKSIHTNSSSIPSRGRVGTHSTHVQDKEKCHSPDVESHVAGNRVEDSKWVWA